jgi:hypothetical protein
MKSHEPLPDERALAIGLAVVGLVLVAWLAHAHAQSAFGITPQQRYCLVDNYDNFFELRIYQPDNGQMIIFGHVHDLTLPKSDPCYTQDYTGSGRLYDATTKGATPLLASFTIEVKDARPECRSLLATLSGSIETTPIVYGGDVVLTTRAPVMSPLGEEVWVTFEDRLPDYLTELLPSCSVHP